MKILQTLYPGIGGNSSVAFSLIEGDERKEFTHTLLGYGIEKPSNLLIKKAKDLKITTSFVIKNKGVDLKAFLSIYKKFKKNKPDYIIIHSTSLIFITWWYSLFNKVKFISVEHHSNQVKTNKHWFFSFFVMLLSPKVVCLTSIYNLELKAKLKKVYHADKTIIINNGINTSRFTQYTNMRKKNGCLVFSMISRLHNLRDHFTLIDAFIEIAEKRNAKLKIAGDGETKVVLEKYVKKKNISKKVIFLGSLKEDEVIELINSTDIYIHSSLAETLSTSLLQVMACKTPIIATDIKGINNLLINNKDALLFKAKDKIDLVKQMNKMIKDKNLPEKLCKNSYNKIIENHSCISMFEKYKEVLINI